MTLGHIGLPVRDLEKSQIFYDAVISYLGLEKIDNNQCSVRYGNDGKAKVYIHTRSEPIHGIHICFEVESKEHVDAFYAAALRSGGTGHGAPHMREQYSPTYYAAYVLDPDGNNIEAVCRH